jgi:hypothetical protein
MNLYQEVTGYLLAKVGIEQVHRVLLADARAVLEEVGQCHPQSLLSKEDRIAEAPLEARASPLLSW